MKSYSRSSLGIISGNLIFGGLGLVQAMVVAAAFGTGRDYDLYLVAQTLPELWNYLLSGLLQSAFLPGFLRVSLRLGQEEGWRLRWASLGFVLAASAGLLILAGVFSQGVVRLMAPGFSPADVAPCARLFRFLLIAAWLNSLVRLLVNLHQAERSFFLPALVQSLSPLAVIASVIWWGAGLGIYALWLGLCLGSLAQAIALWPQVYSWGRSQWRARVWHPEMSLLLSLAWPLILGVLANRINFAVDRAVASTLNWGDISALRFGLLPILTAVWIFSFPFTQALYPRLCRLAEAKRFNQMSSHLADLSQFYIILFTPAAGLGILFAPELVEMLFGRGAFGRHSVAATALALACYSPCLVIMPLVQLLSGLYASLQRTRALSVISAAAVLLNLAADLTLARVMGLAGIALATSLIQAAWAIMLAWWLHRLHPESYNQASLSLAAWCFGLASLIGAGIWLAGDFGLSGLGAKIGLAGLGLVIYALVLAFLFRQRLAQLWSAFQETET